MPVTPDDRMTEPIERVLFWAVATVRRVQSWLSMPRERLENPVVWSVFEKEDEFVNTYRTVLRLRADEVVRVCEKLGITGCTVAKVRKNPFLVALAIDRFLHGGSHEDHQAQDH